MAFKSVFDGRFSLSNILFFASFATDAIDQIVTIASDVFHGSICSTSVITGDGACSVKSGAISAL